MMQPLAVHGLTVPMPGTKLPIVEHVSFGIGAAEVVGIVGESGSGKTTLARAIMGLIAASAGEIAVDGVTLPGLTERSFRKLRQRVALLFQNPANSFNPRFRVGAVLDEACRHLGRQRDAGSLLRLIGLDPALADAFPHMLSGGQARRVALARALAGEPAVIIADEPTAGLDVSAQGEMLNLLSDRRADAGTSLVLITHNLGVVRHMSDRVAVLYLGRIIEMGPTDRIMSAPQHPYTSALIDAEPGLDPSHRRTAAIQGEVPSLGRRPRGCEYHPRCPRVLDRCRTSMPELIDTGDGWSVRCHNPLRPPG